MCSRVLSSVEFDCARQNVRLYAVQYFYQYFPGHQYPVTPNHRQPQAIDSGAGSERSESLTENHSASLLQLVG